MNENQNEYVDINAHDNYPDSEQKIEIPTMKVIPLKKICMTIGALPTSYLDTLSYYEMLVWFIEFLKNNIIPTINNNASAIQEVQSVVLALQNYINNYKDSIDSDVEELEEYMNNYFENLDVQEEINNKLDQMLEDGVLTEIIQQFLQSTAIWCFDNVADMKQATNLINGSFAQTLGYYEKNDGGRSLYKIRTKTNNDVINEMNIININTTLIAELITDNISINIQQLGAKGNNINDDSNYFNFALNNYNKIYLNNKTYLINNTINCNNSNIKLIGNGSKINVNTNGHGFIFKNINNININNIEFNSQKHYTSETSSNINNHIIKIFNCNNINFVNNILNYGQMGLTIGSSNYINIEKNIFSNFKGWALYLGCDDNFSYNITSIKNCNISENKSFNSSYDGIKLTGYIENINIFNNTCYNNVRDGIDYAGHTAKNVQIYNNNCFDNTIQGIDFKNLERNDYPFDNTKNKEFENIMIFNNIIVNNGYYGINSQLYYQDLNINNIIIENNLIKTRNTDTSSSAGTGIRIAPLVTTKEDSVIIKNNIIHSLNSTNVFGIRITNANNIKIINNEIKGNFANCIYIDYHEDLFNSYNAINNNIKIINNDLKTSNNYQSTIKASENGVNNLYIANNKIDNPTTAYLISLTILNNDTNIIINNEYSGTLFNDTPTIRTTKNVIYKSSNPILTKCIGWIGYENSSESRYYKYIEFSN